jgi:hypothetical protein
VNNPPQAQAFLEALRRLGLSERAAQAFIDNGITSVNKLRALSVEALDLLIKQIHKDNQGNGPFIPFFLQQYVQAIRFWATHMHILGNEYTVDQIMEQLAETWNETMRTEQEATKVSVEIIKTPEAFKKDTKWRPWKESVVTYLHSKKGHASLPLAYIIREFDDPLPNVPHATTHDQLVASVILRGPEYNANNRIVFDLLQSLTLSGQAWSWINNFEKVRDGQGAWKALLRYYEGDSMQTRSKQECYDAIAKAVYKGNTRTFDFNTYVTIHQQAHQDLMRLLEPVPENKKVRDFLNGITDPQCPNIKLNVIANPIYMNDFSLMINYFATALDMIKKNDSTIRQISELQTSTRGGRGGRNQGQGFRGGSRGGYGRGGRGRHNDYQGGGRNQRGRGRGRGHGRYDPNDQSIARGYSREDWQNLSQADGNRIYRARDRLETARTVAAMLTNSNEGSGSAAIPDDISALTQTVNPGNNVNAGRDAGNAQRGIAQVLLATVGQSMNRRQSSIGAYSSGQRKLAQINAVTSETTQNHCRAELDSHADTCGVNDVAYILEYLGKVAEVHGFSKSLQAMQDIPIVRAALAYDNAETGEKVNIVINQALYFGNQLSHILLNQNQMRAHGLTVDDCPKHLSKGQSTHSIIIEEHNFNIPLKLHGIMSYFDVWRPTIDEIANCQHIEITSAAEWDPHSIHFAEEETKVHYNMASVNTVNSLNEHYDDFHDKIMQQLYQISVTNVSKTDLFIKSEDLAKKWMVGEKIAQETIKATTQSFVRNAIHPIEHRFRTKVATLRYNQLGCRFYSDTFFSSERLNINNTCGQMFVTNFGFIKFVPMKSKAEASVALMELIQYMGIPKHIHSDGAKEMTQGYWKKICNEFGIRMTQTEKASPWQNRTEIEIRELKRHTRRFMHRTKTPVQLWDFCVNYVAHLRNHIVRPLPTLQGRTPYELVTGNTPDISELLEFEWYQPVWYYEPAEFPHQNKLLGRWIGVAHRIGQALCFWILPKSGVPIARTTIQAIPLEEFNTNDLQYLIQEFDAAVASKLNRSGDQTSQFQLYREDEEKDEDSDAIELMEPEAQAQEMSEVEKDAFDTLLLTEPI